MSSCKTNYKAISLAFCGNMYSSRIACLRRLFHEYHLCFLSFFFSWSLMRKSHKGPLKHFFKRLTWNTLCKLCLIRESFQLGWIYSLYLFAQRVGSMWIFEWEALNDSFKSISRLGSPNQTNKNCHSRHEIVNSYFTARKWMNLNTKWAVH